MTNFYKHIVSFCCSLACMAYGVFTHTLVIVDYISKMVSSSVMRLSYAHTVVRQEHIAVIAWEVLGKIASEMVSSLFCRKREEHTED